MHIYLRPKINVILTKRNIVVVLRRKPDAMTMLPNVERRPVTEIKIQLCVTVALTRSKRQARIIVMTNQVNFT